MQLAVSNTETMVAENAKLLTVRKKPIITRFFQVVHFYSFVFKYSSVGMITVRASPNEPPTIPKAFVMSGNMIAIKAAKLISKNVARTCSHVLVCLSIPISLNTCSRQGA